MRFFGHTARGLLLVLLTGGCWAPSGTCAADNATAKTAAKTPAQSPAGSTHPATQSAKTTGARAPTTHPDPHPSATRRSIATPPGSHPATAQAHTAYAAKSGPHPTYHASAHRAATRSKARVRTMNGGQRLARLHLQPDRVEQIQQALIREGYLQGGANGQWDLRTHNAMVHYQSDHGFPATGLPEAKSLMKLGLGPHDLPAQLDHPAASATPSAAPGAPVTAPTAQAPAADPAATHAASPVSQSLPPS